jgi:uncharacterized protein
MATIAVIGITGYAGGAIAAEALRRGHQVIGVSRSGAAQSQPGLTLRRGTIADAALIKDLAQQSSAVIVATHASDDNGSYLAGLVPSLVEAVTATKGRLGFIGGAGSLQVAPGGPRLVDTPEFPEPYTTEALAHAEVLDLLRSTAFDADWFYVSPAAEFGKWAPGARTGQFRIGGDVLLVDAAGKSFIGGEDLAIAVIDEIERPAHHAQRFTVAY